jgi:hypothetical protein
VLDAHQLGCSNTKDKNGRAKANTMMQRVADRTCIEISASPCFPRMDVYEVAKARLSTGAGAEPRTTFEKKVSILRGEVYFLDKDLLMGADHGYVYLLKEVACMQHRHS